MNPEVLEKILRCDKLPTLPAVATRVVELTNGKDVSMTALAQVIQLDQALTAKILRTVNSSLFGLRRKCASINQAIVMLGLNSVKTLALGFTLVGAIDEAVGGTGKSSGLDMAAHWRRSLNTAAAARALANLARLPNPEECFLGGLLQDVGMIAMHLAMGDDYARIIAEARGNHAAVTRLELAAFATQHADVGAMLVSRWKLPDQLVMPIKYHERPTAAPNEYHQTCRAVGLGNLGSEILNNPNAAEPLRRFYSLCERWFAIKPAQADEVLDAVSEQAREMATLLKVPIAPGGDAAALIAAARAQLAAIEVVDEPMCAAATLNQQDSDSIDDMTGVASRNRFDQSIIAAFEQARELGTPLSLALFAVDDLDAMAARLGPDVRDTVLIAVAGRLERAFLAARPLVCRFDSARFAVLLHKTNRFNAVRLTEETRAAVAREPVALIAARSGAPPSVNVSVTAGLASIDKDEHGTFADAGELVIAVEQSLDAARQPGANGFHLFAPVLKAA